MQLSRALMLLLLTNICIPPLQPTLRISFTKIRREIIKNNPHLNGAARKKIFDGIKIALFEEKKNPRSKKVFNYLKSLYSTFDHEFILPPQLSFGPCFSCENQDIFAITTPCCWEILCKICFFKACVPENPSCPLCNTELFWDEDSLRQNFLLAILNCDEFDAIQSASAEQAELSSSSQEETETEEEDSKEDIQANSSARNSRSPYGAADKRRRLNSSSDTRKS